MNILELTETMKDVRSVVRGIEDLRSYNDNAYSIDVAKSLVEVLLDFFNGKYRSKTVDDVPEIAGIVKKYKPMIIRYVTECRPVYGLQLINKLNAIGINWKELKSIGKLDSIVTALDNAIESQNLYVVARDIIELKKMGFSKNLNKITVPRIQKLENLFDVTLKNELFDKSISYYQKEISEVTPGFSNINNIITRNKENIIRQLLIGIKKGDTGAMFGKVSNGIRDLKTANIHWPEFDAMYKSMHGRPAEDDDAHLKHVLTSFGVDPTKYGFK
jgi:hypothetical protein